MTDTQTAPDWSAGSLASVLPSVADRLGVSRYAGRDVFDLPAVPRTVVVLVDGLGHDLLLQRSGHAPFLRSHLQAARRVPCGAAHGSDGNTRSLTERREASWPGSA